jgi:hypothetical protein
LELRVPLAKVAGVHVSDSAYWELREQMGRMGRRAAVVLYVLALVAVVVGVDVLFFRNQFWERLTVNVGIVLVFVAFYLRFLKRP